MGNFTAIRRLSCLFLSAAFVMTALTSCEKENHEKKYYPPEESEASESLSSEEAGSEQPSDPSSSDESSAPEEKPEEIYDVAPVVKAYRSGDSSALSDLDAKILEKASEIIGEIITDDMTDYEKELAVHDYLVYNCTYDKGALAAIPKKSENSENPYGALVNRSSICLGYTTSFCMFMGMLDIPCGIVHSVDTAGDEHAWNTVKLNDNWYYVDVTWDDPVPDKDNRPVTHTYFNVSKKFISDDHVLPEGSPETESTEFSYFEQSAVMISDPSQLSEAIKNAVEHKSNSAVVIFDDALGVTFKNSIETERFTPDIPSDLYKKINSALKENGCVMGRMTAAETGLGTAVSLRFYSINE